MADAKTRQAQEDLIIAKAEADNEVSKHQQRILYNRGKQEERSLVELKREHSLAIEELKQKLYEKEEEVEYLNTKVAKLEQKNKELIMMKDSKEEIRKLEAQVSIL